MTTVQDLQDYLERFAPAELAEPWDNIGLLVGNRTRQVNRLMTCLTITPESVEEAIQQQANMIVTHHPVMFHPVKKITTDSTEGTMLLDLIRHDIAVYSPHTAFDSTAHGINDLIASAIDLSDLMPLQPLNAEQSHRGAGRFGKLSSPIGAGALIARIKTFFGIRSIGIVGSFDRNIESVAIACGSGGSFLPDAIQLGADAFITGEATFHTCLQAKADDLMLLLLGHFASERFALQALAEQLKREFQDIEIWASEKESDPILWA